MDNVIFKEKECETCQIMRPARSKHCALCHKCVARFDHHCAWVNNCIGEYNVKYFISFLGSTATLCLYGSVLCVEVGIDIVNEKQLFSMMMKTPAGSVPVTWDIAFRWMMMMHAPLISLGLFMGVIALVLYAFMFYHMYLVARNSTTSETFKWADAYGELRYLKRKQAEALKRARESNQDGTTPQPVSLKADPKKDGKGDKKGEKRSEKKAEKKATTFQEHLAEGDTTSAPTDEQLIAMELPKTLENVYNRGVVHNFMEIIFPKSLRRSK